MKDITLEELEKVRENYIIQLEEAKTRLVMVQGAIQATDALIKLAKGEIKLETEKPS